jgi:hypothetical protein
MNIRTSYYIYVILLHIDMVDISKISDRLIVTLYKSTVRIQYNNDTAQIYKTEEIQSDVHTIIVQLLLCHADLQLATTCYTEYFVTLLSHIIYLSIYYSATLYVAFIQKLYTSF